MSLSFEPGPAVSKPHSVSFYSAPDPAKYLPAGPPTERYRALVQRVDDLHRLIPGFDLRHQASLDRLAVETRLRELTGHRSIGGFGLQDGDPQLAPVRQELEELTAAQARLVELDTARSKAYQPCGTLLSNTKAWIADGRPRGTAMEAIKIPAPKLLKAETIAAAIDRLRQQAKELREKLTEIERAPAPSTTAKARMREQIAAIAARGAVDVCRLVADGGKIGFPETRLTLKVYNSEPAATAIGQVPDVLALLALLNGAALTALLDKEIAAISDDAHALTDEQRQKQTAQTIDALFAVELDEATLTFEAWHSGLPIEANDKIGPAALLAVRNVVMPPVDMAASSTSPLAYDIVGPRR